MPEVREGGAFAAAFKDSIPVFMGYVPLGIVFGFLFVQAGGSWEMAALASLIVYGGASQYMMIPMLVASMPVAAIALATLVINLRHVFYGISLLTKIPQHGWKRWYIVFALTDETFSLLTILPEGTHAARVVWLAFLNHMWWLLGTVIGAAIGAQAQTDLVGIDFVLTALFAMIAAEQWRARVSAWPLVAALVSFALARWLWPDYALAVSMAFCVAAGFVWAVKRRKDACVRGDAAGGAQ